MERRILPLLLIAFGVWLLTGCFKSSVRERAAFPQQTDFRDVFGDSQSHRPIRTGMITREQIIARLGEPQLTSADRKAIGYEYQTVRAVWSYPLCFRSQPAEQRLYVVRIDFDRWHVLQSWRIAYEDDQHGLEYWPRARWQRRAERPLGLRRDLSYDAGPPATLPSIGPTPIQAR